MTDVVISGAAEGLLDGVVLRTLITYSGYQIGPIYGERGVSDLLANLHGYDAAAEHAPWFVLFDLDRATCAPGLLSQVLPVRSRYMCSRIAVREVESWLLADRERIGRFMRVPVGSVPADPDELPDPKAAMVRLASRSRSNAIVRRMVNVAHDGRTGPAYTATLIEFVNSPDGWRPDVARRNSESLDRALTCLAGCAADWIVAMEHA